VSSTATRTDASRVLLGLGNTVDLELCWDSSVVAGLVRQHRLGEGGTAPGEIATEADLVRSLLDHLGSGEGGEHYVSSVAVLAAFAARFDVHQTLGGTNVRAALAMRPLGRSSTVHLVSTGAATHELLPDDLCTISSARGDTFDPHVIVQFPAGASVVVGGRTVVAPRANRVIYVNDRPNAELVVAEEFGEAASRADVVLVSGLNSIQDVGLLDRRLDDVRRHLARRRPGAVAVYEHGAFHAPRCGDLVVRRLGSCVDVWSCNEEELQEHLHRRIELLSPQQVLDAVRQVRDSVGAETLVVHTRRWALALGGAEPLRRAMVVGGLRLAGARYRHGDEVTATHLAGVAGWPRQPDAVAFAEALEHAAGGDLTCRAAYALEVATPTTIGLGDAFVGGLVAALADQVDASR